jgi:cytochrome c-type biogenesis protein
MGPQHVDGFSAWLAGLLTFFTPCVVPLLPGWLALVAGVDYEALKPGAAAPPRRLEVLLPTIAFVAGFGLVFTALGVVASGLGSLLWDHRDLIRYVGAAVMALLGLGLLGILRLPFLAAERRVHLKARPAGLLGALLVGMAFAAGWTPCAGPVLGALMMLAWSEAELWRGAWLLALFSAGLGLPFLALAMGWSTVLPLLRRLKGLTRWTGRILGAMLLILAVLLALDKLHLVTPSVKPGF